jgi:multidrug efflux pump subunit AcrB
MKSFFTSITALSLRFRWVTLLIALLVSIAGVVAIGQLQQELIPGVEFPQTIILSQVSGMTSEQVLNIVTSRMEQAIDEQVPEVANIESSTTGAFGAVVTARNDFGLNQARIRSDIQAALDSVWLPLRRIAAPEGEAAQAFTARLMNDLPADVLIYLQEQDQNFLFQLTPEVWESLSDQTVNTLVAYLAAQTQENGADSALRQLVEQEIVPALENLEIIASASVSGGQILPDESGNLPTTAPATEAEPESLLLQVSPEVWAVIASRTGYTGALDNSAVDALRGDVAVPAEPPALPQSWQMNHFVDASDIQEMRSLTRTTSAVLNQFVQNGTIVGSLGQTNDLTPEVVTQMMSLDPTMVNFFEAEQLAALSPEVFAVLPAEFIAGLDGFTRDELAARALAQTISGETAQPDPVNLPSAWRISPPQMITFSFDDLPLATFSIAGTGMESSPAVEAAVETPTEMPATQTETVQTAEIPEGPALPLPFGLLGGFIGVELNTADDLINLQLPENLAEQFGSSSLSAAQLLNFLLLLGNPEALPEGTEMPSIPIDAAALISGLSPEVISFLAEYDPTFLPNLSADVFNAFSDDVLALDNIAPPLDQVWNTLSNQPQFRETPLRNAQDVIAIGGGSAARVLNTINDTVPEQFAGYEVRLFDSLSPAILRYFTIHEPDFYSALESDVLLKLSPVALVALPESVVATLPADVQAQVSAIASGDQPSAAEALAEIYATDAPPADPNAPTLNSDWAFIGDFMGTELDTADDFFRFFPSPTNFLNSFFDTAQGASFAPNLFGGLTPEMVQYMQAQDATLFPNLRIEALQLLSPETLAALPQDVQDRAVSGAAPFSPTDPVTRSDGNNSLLITVYKAGETNTVEAFHAAEEAINEIAAENPNISVGVSFEQASFIEESISGVAREGGLGAIFAIVVILVFLSGGSWANTSRRLTAAVIIAVSFGLLIAVVAGNAGAVGGDFAAAWDQTDVLVRGLLLMGVAAGLLIMLWPGRVGRPAWRSTLVTAISIPLSVLMAMALMRWFPPAVNSVLAPVAEGSSILTFILRLFPESITLNIMTLSGLTVAIGRVVDDSIVVLENIYRQVQEGGDKKDAILHGVRDVSVAIFAATVITVVVFLPLGLTGGIIGEFFLPFGLAVTYALLSSFVVAITVVPVAAYFLLDAKEMPEEEEEGTLERAYLPALRWSLGKGWHKVAVLGIAFLSLVISMVLFGTLPQAFLPSFGEPQIAVSVNMPAGTKIIQTNALVEQFEAFLDTDLPEGAISRVQTIVGGGGASIESLLLGSTTVSENIGSITIAVEDPSQLDAITAQVRTAAESIFGEANTKVSAASLSEQGFGGFALVLSGPQEDLEAINATVIETLNNVDGLANATSNLAGLTGGGESEDAPPTIIRIDGQPAVEFSAELETENTLGVTALAKAAVLAIPDLPDTISVSEGFETELQTQGFTNLIGAMGIAIVLVIIILMITFRSVVHWLDIILSIIVAPVGAAVALALTNRVLGISAMIGMLMLIGIVVTNAVVLIDRVQSNMRERNMNTYDALMEGGKRRLRPILMTAIATIMALIPLAIGLSSGAIIASELGTVVIGGLVSSTILTLIIVPVAFSLLEPLNRRINSLFGGRKSEAPPQAETPATS